VAAAVGLFALVRYLDERRRERSVRVEDNIDRSLERLLEYPLEGKGFNVRTINALQSLERWISLSPKSAYFRDRVTDAIVETVMHDLDWTDRRHAGFDRLCLEHWIGYREWLRVHPDDHRFLLEHYENALRGLYDKEPETFSHVVLVGRGFKYFRETDRDDGLLFERLVAAYQYHLSLIEDGVRRDEVVSRFRAALHNPDLTRQLFVDEGNPAVAASAAQAT
jgi:hypothetical protein